MACEIHPLDNLRVLRYLVHDLKLSDDDKNRWYRHWIAVGLETVERKLAGSPATGRFCDGDVPTLADLTLVPQIFNAQRMDCPLDAYPTVMRVFAECMRHDAFVTTQPSACPDAS
jgi:maleylacetoacetate isomerase/maleylpyruvate isomerase